MNQIDNRRMATLIDRFEIAWQEGFPDIRDFLPSGDPAARHEVLIELIMIDMERRWQATTRPREADVLPERPRLDDYVAVYEELRQLAELPVDLIAQEYRVLSVHGEKPSQDEWLRRFPHHGQRLRQTLDAVDQELAVEFSGRDETKSQATPPGDTKRSGGGAAGDDAETGVFHSLPSDSAQTLERSANRPAPPPEEDDHPENVGRYRIDHRIASGTFGSVYLAHDSELNRPVALKLPRDQVSSSSAIDEFRSEAQKLASLSHPHLVAVYDFGVHESERPYVVTEYLDGQTLEQRLHQGDLSPRAATQVMRQVCDALHAAHRRGLVHRDVKPGNIIFDGEGSPRLADFGLALLEDEQLSRRGEVAGTPAYMAPEQVAGRSHHLDGRADIWAIGVILYQIWSGRLPFRAETRLDLFEQILERPAKPLSMVADVSPALNATVMRCLEKRPEDRFPSAQAVADELARWLDEESPAAPQVPSSSGSVAAADPSARSGSRLTVPLAALAAAILIWLGVQWGLSGRSTEPDVAGKAPTGTGVVAPEDSAPAESAATVDAGADAPPLLEGNLAITLWNEPLGRKRIPLAQAFPLQQGDAIRLDVELTEPAFMYLFWIASDGVVPLYPWTPGDWSPPTTQQKRRELSLPQDASEAWPLEVSEHMDTVVLLASQRPLDERGLAETLDTYPVPRSTPAPGVIPLSTVQLRGLDTARPINLTDEVQAARRYLNDRLSGRADLMLAWGFSNGAARERAD